MEFKEKIKELRKQNGLSQGDLAEIAGVQQTSISNIENGITGKEIIKVGIAQKIAKALNISFNELFEIEIPSSNNDKIVELEKKIAVLEEQLQDKRKIIDFLSTNVNVAAGLYQQENPYQIEKRDFNDIDVLIEEINNRPYDPGDLESIKKYVTQKLDELKRK